MIIKDIKLIFHERRMPVLLGILILLAVVGIMFGRPNTESAKVAIGVADNDNSEYSKLLLSYFEENDVFNSYIDVYEGSEDELAGMFGEGRLDMYLVIPEEFTEKLIYIDNTPIKAVVNSSDRTKSVVYKNLLDSYAAYISSVELNCQALYDIMLREGYDRSEVDNVNVAISYELIFTALGKDDFFKRVEIERFEGVSLVNYYVYSAMVLLVLYIGLFAGLGAIRERLSNVSLRLKSTGIGRGKQLFSKWIAYGLTTGVIAAAVMLLINASGRMNFTAGSILFIIAAIFASCLIFLLISSVPDSEGGYVIFANMMILLVTIVGGGIIPIMYLPEAIANVARFTPNYWFIKVLL